MKFLTSFIIGCICKQVYCDPDTPSDPNAANTPPTPGNDQSPPGSGGSSNQPPTNKPTGNTPSNDRGALVKSGCNFSGRTDMGVDPFGSIKKADDEMCIVEVKNDANAFLYSCDGVSDPPMCPEVVKFEDNDVNIKTLFTQATITDETAKHGGIHTFHVFTGKAQREFSAKCVCTKKDGKTETMNLTSSFGKVGIFAAFGAIFLVSLNHF